MTEVVMKRIKIISLLVAIALSVTVAAHADGRGMEHLDDHGTKCSIEFMIKDKNKKRYTNKG